MRTAVYTLGCKLNQCESEALASSFESRGFFIVSPKEEADIYIVNTCTVTSKAEQKARRMIRLLSQQHPGSAVIVTGCYAQLDGASMEFPANVIIVSHDGKDLLSRLPGYFSSLERPDDIPEAVRGYLSGTAAGAERRAVGGCEEVFGAVGEPERFWYDSVDFSYHSRAFLKIQDGCENSCAYCRVTIARGDSVSLPLDRLLKQFRQLAGSGYREIVLTGVNISLYRSEAAGNGAVDFSGLLERLAFEAEKSGRGTRIRLSSVEPEAIDERFAAAVSSDRICPHFHIPVQSGSDRILKLMNRRGDRETVLRAVELLRSVKNDPFIAADIIAGFPGETEEDFNLSYELLRNSDFSALHVFPFSPRPGTAAAEMRPQVPERLRTERTSELRKLSRQNYSRYLERCQGREVEVLIERIRGKKAYGTSGNYLKCAVCDILNSKEGELCRALIDKDACIGSDNPSDAVLCRIIEAP